MLDYKFLNSKFYLAPSSLKLDTTGRFKVGNSVLSFDNFSLFFRSENTTKILKFDFENLIKFAKENHCVKEVEEKIHSIISKRHNIQGVSFKTPKVMGILNVTPDSFSDGGRYFSHENAINHGKKLSNDGAAILDIGGESSRPGSNPISFSEEYNRVIPVVKALSKNILISVDTNKSKVMSESLKSGAKIINDVSSLTRDSKSLNIIKSSSCGVVLMHSKGLPVNMQDNPIYDDPILEIYDYLEDRVKICEKVGIEKKRIIVDPGIGFGKNDFHTKRIFRYLNLFHGLGCVLLVGSSRKSFIGRWSKIKDNQDRIGGSIASALWAINSGVNILRAHDVSPTLQAINIWTAIAEKES